MGYDKNQSRFLLRIRQFGGLRLLSGYARYGVAGLAVRNGISVLMHKQSAQEASAAMSREVIPKLRRKYEGEIHQWVEEYDNTEWRQNKHGKTVWIYWMQGFEQAPLIVKRCVESVKRYLPDYEITLLSKENLSQHVTFPEHVERKYKRGIIPEANFSDMIRLELLTRYGGTWLDATVMMTGGDFPRTMLEGELFLFQQKDRNNPERFIGISSWMISSVAGHPLLEAVKKAMYRYWDENNCLLEYYLFHLFFGMAVEAKSELIDGMEKRSNHTPHLLQRRLADNYDEAWMDELKQRAWFHKLTYRIPEEAKREGTFYDFIINQGMALS